MQTVEHQEHIKARVSHSNCDECVADNQRWHAQTRPFVYSHVRQYLTYVRPRLAALKSGRNGGLSVEAGCWYRRFRDALHKRVSSHAVSQGRKYADGYLDRLRMADVKCGPENARPDAAYLRRFAERRASCLS